MSSTECDMGSQSKRPLLGRQTLLNGKWKILQCIRKGGKREIYLARQVTLDRRVVVRVISKEFVESFEGDQSRLKRKFPSPWPPTSHAQNMHDQMHRPSSGVLQPREFPHQAPPSDQFPSRATQSSPDPTKNDMPLPVLAFPAKGYGIRGLEGHLGKWALRSERTRPGKAEEIDYVVIPRGVRRCPWEAFEDVSFRTALSPADN